jgi:exopolysaccharide biosynthesis protein
MHNRVTSLHDGRAALALLALTLATTLAATAGTVLGPWVPRFQGVEFAAGTNTPGGGGFPNLQVAYFVRVDLTDTNVQLYASPRIPTSYQVNYRETQGYTTTNFLKNHNLQVAINANSFFLPGESGSPGYTLAEGTAFNASGLLFSQGVQVSPQSTSEDCSALMFTSNNVATFIPTNWPVAPTNGIFTAVSGLYPILVNGVNIGSNYLGSGGVHSIQPRTLFGLSQNRRYLYLLAIDGRQTGYSEGAYDWEAAAWLVLAGASDGVNMDGGGSTCLARADSTGHPIAVNRDSASPAVGRERTVGAHFGVYASPLPGFFNDVTPQPDNTTATITWTTISPATTQLRYGLTTDLDLLTSSNSALVTNHAVLLTNLTPGTGYYFTALASIGANQYVSSNYYFVTTNYVTTNALLDLTNIWKYTTANRDGVNWTARNYDDSAWEGAGAGLLWVDINGLDGDIPVALNTQMPEDPNSGYPFVTYYFRTHFNFTNPVAGAALQFVGYEDDGAVFYLNGTEICRVRMPAAPEPIYNATLATVYPCAGNASCPDSFHLSGPLVTTNLLTGDNVLAVEVHNYNTGSSDVTFGLAAASTAPYEARPQLNLSYSNSAVTLSWSRSGFTLQEANAPTGTWNDVPGPVFVSPFTTNSSGAARFFRLRQ